MILKMRYLCGTESTLFCPFIIGYNLLEIISGKEMDLIVLNRYSIHSFNCQMFVLYLKITNLNVYLSVCQYVGYF